MRRPQRTEDRLRAGGEDGAYLCGSLEGWGEQTNGPARSRRRPPAAEVRARGVPPPLFSQLQHGESATQRHGACGVAMHAACARCMCRRDAAACSAAASGAAVGRPWGRQTLCPQASPTVRLAKCIWSTGLGHMRLCWLMPNGPEKQSEWSS